MDQAIVVLLGVTVGAVATGAVQSMIALRDRDRSGRASAQILFSDLWLAEVGINTEIKNGEWDSAVRGSLRGDLDRWGAHHERFAHVVNGHEFHTVASAFAMLTQLLFVHEAAGRKIEKGFSVPSPDPLQLLANAEDAEAARAILWRVGIESGDDSIDPDEPPSARV
jgi:hypothetical protein